MKEILVTHTLLVAHFGGSLEVRDPRALHALVEAPQKRKRASLPFLAAMYAYGICRKHPFVDGNERLALTILVAFLGLNGLRPNTQEPEACVLIEGLTRGRVSRIELANSIICGPR